jgi:hypothetical protein
MGILSTSRGSGPGRCGGGTRDPRTDDDRPCVGGVTGTRASSRDGAGPFEDAGRTETTW